MMIECHNGDDDGDDEDDDDGDDEPDDQPRYEATTTTNANKQPQSRIGDSPMRPRKVCASLARAPKQYGTTPASAAPQASTAYPHLIPFYGCF